MAEPQGSTEKRGGSYAIHAEIGSGGMATVHLGRLVGARGFARTVAIKVLHASYAKNKEFVTRFVDEARLVGRIHHPNVMPTLDVIAEGDDLRIVMEYVAGESLDQLQASLRAKGERVPPRIACAVITGVLHGLHAAHEAKNEFGEPLGIVHLDVSPQNILVGTDGTTRVLDFGVARARGERAEAATGGKSAYLAPEQVRGAEVTPRTDVFAASIVLWEMLTGESLFSADNHAATMQRVLGCVVPLASEKVPDLPPRLDEVLKTGLRRDPAQRFATARDMALELEQAIVPALQSEVGRWVETTAEASLVARAAKVSAMEADSAQRQSSPASALPGLVSTRALYDEQAAVNLPAGGAVVPNASAGSLMGASDKVGLVPERVADGSIRWKARPPPALPQRPSPTGVALPTPPVPVAKTRERRPRRPLLWIALGTALVALVLVAFGARAMLLPGYVRNVAVQTALTYGIDLSVTDAALGDDGVVLRGLTAKLVGVPQVSITVDHASVRVAWSSPTKVVLGKTEALVDGEFRATLAALGAWSTRASAKPKDNDETVGGVIEIPAGHLLWTHVDTVDDVARIEASNLQGAIGSSTAASLGDDAHLLTNALVIETKRGNFGPWMLDVDATPKGARARLAFDPAVPDGPNALLVDDAAGDASFELTIPRVATASLGIPRTALGADTPLPHQIEVSLHYGRLNREQSSATLRGTLYGVRVPELGSSVDAHVSAEAAGPPTGPMTVKNGVLTLGAIRATAAGSLTPAVGSCQASLSWRSDPAGCASLVSLPSPAAAAVDVARKAQSGDLGDLGDLARDFGALGQAVGAVKVTGTFAASGTLVGDLFDPSRLKFTTVAKNACGIALFQAK